MKNTDTPVEGNLIPRFFLTVGDYTEAHPSAPADLPLGIYDLKARKMVMALTPEYENLICLETVGAAPFTALKEWLNATTEEAFESEGIPNTHD